LTQFASTFKYWLSGWFGKYLALSPSCGITLVLKLRRNATSTWVSALGLPAVCTVLSVANAIDFTPNPARRHTRGRRGKVLTGIADLQADFDLAKDEHAIKLSGRVRSKAKKMAVKRKEYTMRGFRGKTSKRKAGRSGKRLAALNSANTDQVLVVHQRMSESEKKRRRAETARDVPVRQFQAAKSRVRRGQLGLAKKQTGGVNIIAAVRNFQRTGRLPNLTVEQVRSASATNVDAGALKRMIKLMLVRAGIEENPGPICPDCGKTIDDDVAYRMHRKKAKCVKAKERPRYRVKAGRSGGRQRLVEQAVHIMRDQVDGQRDAMAEKAKDASQPEKDEGPIHLGGQLPAPRNVYYRVGDFAVPIGVTKRQSGMPHFITAMCFLIAAMLTAVYIFTRWFVGAGWALSDVPFAWGWILVCLLSDTITWICACNREDVPDVDIVDADGYYTDLTPDELALRSDDDDTYHFKGRFVSYSNWRQTQGVLNFASPDRLDSRVMCVPNLWTVARRETYCYLGRLIDRTVDVHVSGTTINSMAAERFGMLRGKSYEEGRRILQLYADTQNHTQIDLSWNLVGEPTSLAENCVEYCCALRMIEAGDSTRLKGVEARCFQ
jgi:hypothetical protein